MTLEQRVENLEQENQKLRTALKGTDEAHFPAKWNLNPAEKRILRSLVTPIDGFRSREALHLVSAVNPEANPAMLNVHVSRLRKKLAPHGICIEPVYGHGYKIDSRSRIIVLSERTKAAMA